MKEIPLASTPRDGSTEQGTEAVPPGWVAQDAFRMLSMAFSVKSEDERFSESLRWHLGPFLLDAPAPASIPAEFLATDETGEPAYIFRFSTYERFRVTMLAEAIHRTVWELHRAVHDQVRDFLLLHAGAVVRGGHALLLPAETASGKSSLTLGLLEKGASYLSDDLAPLDPVTNRAYPFPKRIKLIPDALEFFPGLEERLGDRDLPFSQFERFVRPEDVGASVAEPATVKWGRVPDVRVRRPPGPGADDEGGVREGDGRELPQPLPVRRRGRGPPVADRERSGVVPASGRFTRGTDRAALGSVEVAGEPAVVRLDLEVHLSGGTGGLPTA